MRSKKTANGLGVAGANNSVGSNLICKSFIYVLQTKISVAEELIQRYLNEKWLCSKMQCGIVGFVESKYFRAFITSSAICSAP